MDWRVGVIQAKNDIYKFGHLCSSFLFSSEAISFVGTIRCFLRTVNFITLVWEGRCAFPLSYVDKTHQKDKIEAIFPHQDHISRCCFVAKLWLYGEVMTELYLPLVREQKLMNTTIYRVQEQVCELWARKPSLQFVPFHSTTFSSEDTTYHIREISFLARLLDLFLTVLLKSNIGVSVV